jgi:PAS domain S-box-containing protein
VDQEDLDLEARNRVLKEALQEANETLDAIRNGDVDAVVVGGPEGQIVYTLENADRPYRVLVEQMREGAATLSGDGVILYCNRAFADLLGRRFEDLVGERIFNFVGQRGDLERLFAQSTLRGLSIELSFVTEAGPCPANLSLVELAVEDGAERMLCMIVTDLRQNYERAREVSEANRRLESEIADRTRVEQSLAIALDAAQMGSWELNLDTDYAIRSALHDTIFGYAAPLHHWRLHQTLDHFIDDDRAAVAEAFRQAQITGRLDFEKRIRRANDHAIRWVHVRGATFYRHGKPERIAGIIVDNTERRLIDEQLRQGQKMEAIGQLTGGIAHDFNNLLMIIGGSLESLSRRVTLDDRVQKLLDAARIGVARGAKLNEQLLAFARRQDMHEEVVCLTDLLPTFETLLDRAIGEAVKVDILRTDGLWSCRTDSHQLETAILNLAINARDAMDNTGALVLATANVQIGADQAERHEAKAGDYVMVSVTDTGSGMSPEVAARVFEPFFTTKELGRGTGLGLSQVYGFARQSGGFITLDSVAGLGTTVSIYLPRAEPVERAHPAAESPHPSPGYQGAVLLVEDDADVRGATYAMLEELGYAIVEAGSCQEALDILASGRHVDLVFTDVIMASGITGIELARAIKAGQPDLPVLLTSGYTAQRMAPTAGGGELPLLRKPYTLTQLAEAIDKALTDGSSPAHP